MAVENIPAWPFPANWDDTVSESLSWMTDVMVSKTGVEQRRTLRPNPRREFQFNAAIRGEERSLYDNLMTAYGSSRWYVPLWHHVCLADWPSSAGDYYVFCTNIAPEIKAGSFIFITGPSAYSNQVGEVTAVDPYGITLNVPLAFDVPLHSQIHPCTRARMIEQPVATKRTSDLYTVPVTFAEEVSRPNPSGTERTPTPRMRGHLGYPVLGTAPDDRETMTHTFERMLDVVDNQTSLPYYRDTAGRSFSLVDYTWTMHDLGDRARLMEMIYAMRGRAMPVWVPTFMDDLVMTTAILDGVTNLRVKRNGLYITGGIREDRRDIFIDAGVRQETCRLTNVTQLSNGDEYLSLSAPFEGGDLFRQDINRICFMALMRLNHDTVEITHRTDTRGTSTVKLVFRSVPLPGGI